jgi:hypothetical protein
MLERKKRGDRAEATKKSPDIIIASCLLELFAILEN